MSTANPHRHEEKVAHNNPLLRRVIEPFSKRPIVDNLQRGSRSIVAVRTRIYPQVWQKRHKFIPISQTDYNEQKAELLGWAANVNLMLENGARHLKAFCNGAVPLYAGSEPTTIMRNEPGLSHPVGVAFTPTSNPGASFKAVISSAHELSGKLVESIAMRDWLSHEFDSINDFIRSEIVQARKDELQKLSFEVPADIKSMSFYPVDPDLLVCLGKVKLIEPIIKFDVDMLGTSESLGMRKIYMTSTIVLTTYFTADFSCVGPPCFRPGTRH